MAEKTKKYIESIGRRKTSTARVRLYQTGSGQFIVNEKPATQFFKFFEYKNQAFAPLEKTGQKKVDVSVKVVGGGQRGQAEAIRQGLSRSLIKMDENLKTVLKAEGFLTRDPRAKERKKPGLKKARRAPQWRKR